MGVCALLFRLVAAAAPLFYWAVVRPAYRGRPLPSAFGAPFALWAAISSFLLFAFSLPEPWLQMATVTGQSVGDVLRRPELAARLIADTRFGRIWLLHQAAALILTSVGALNALRGGRRSFLWTFAAVISAGLLAFTALRGQAGTYRFLAGFNHALHWIAAALWLGGLAHVLWLRRETNRHHRSGLLAAAHDTADTVGTGAGRTGAPSPEAALREDVFGTIVASFGPVALSALVVTVATGAVNGWLYVPSLSHLARPGYGGWLLLKLILVSGLLSLALYNAWQAASRTAASPAVSPRAGTSGLIGASNLGGASDLGGTSQPAGGAEAATDRRATGPLAPSLALEAIVGLGVLAASERLARQPPLVLAAHTHPGRAGRLVVSIAGLSTAVGIVLVAAGIILAVIGFRRWRKAARGTALASAAPRRALFPVPPHLAGVGLGVAAACAGAALFVGSLLVPVTPEFATPNPLPADASTLARGQSLYVSHCALCHGEQGRGDGLLATSLRTPPGDLTSRRVQARSDGDLMWTISEGVEGTEMMPFDFLSEEERWAIVHYIRTLPQGAAGSSGRR